ncbi:Phosphoglycolate phosphatase [Lentilactobacillus parabuchneri]|jgi:phosphoglycolate phosphatase-like HAD superfamily hydrolase|uniref:Phosphoglycolate phosphatase n=3 Tax=Lentilactobacillus parabuchneri TaxID=152331 RepID=A0A1X1FBV5_9LACO|nr:HAD hydrolase-like protein [Lentilactobacillus parabuchneri]KRM47753.1 HAD-superfamily hydrolase [Lentilactobacillus parabuchneri DSM 5707 = NBRC 107865]KRN80226.1 HAD-superfamily hydrolase [Lentilactobacillus parabuchneri]MBW0221826.1 HAD hydrolase-like protein [Lentilactobacillus parabuchneri]MBW0244950.1 HAD hydrolase-like protein [Lentilactobacillus parabuchneri]MBW0263028.1 HAD hydrolase-like protein [Lentilactobacillus parabuchneri]
MINQLFWDFDGTLFDTYPKMVAAFMQALSDLGIDDVEIDEHQIYETMRQHDVGTAIRKFSAFYGLKEASLRKLNCQYQTKMVADALPFPGVKEVLSLISGMDGRNFLLTHRDNQAKGMLDQFGLLDFFSGFVTSDQDFPRKPQPDSINWLIETYEVDRKKAIMIGDRKLDVAAGHNANIASCLFDPDGTIVDSGNPEIRVTEINELVPWLTNK